MNMAKNKILVVDDEKLIVKGIKFSLEQDGMTVDCAYDGEEALEYFKNNEYSLVLLDLMLPKIDGFEVCRQIRENSEVPIIMLTAKSDDIDKIMGLEYGADDYVTKPFNILEVKARIKAIIRRSSKKEKDDSKQNNDNIIEIGNLRFDKMWKRLYIEGKEINLTGKEYEVLEFLATRPNRIYSRDALLKEIWGKDYAGEARTVDVHIRRLREKIETDPGEPKYVHTKWGAGYYFQG